MYLQINGYIPAPPPVVNPWGNTPQPDAATPAAPSQETRPTPPTQTETQQYNGPLYTRGTGKSARAQVIGAGTGCKGAVSGKTIFGHGEFRDASQTSPQIKVIIDFVENVRWPTSD